MIAIVFLIVLIAVCVLGAVYGADSRHVTSDRHTPNWR
jgi:hypothetical protein